MILYAGPIIEALKRGDPGAAELALKFMRFRLTDAAIHGCHHCDENELVGVPCHWCGLKTRKAKTR